jgi:CheY-like chemotaxis protein
MNLAANAAHAMEGTKGCLTIELDSVVFSANDHLPSPRLRPGTYARLTVQDTGCGMEDSVRVRIFEPFFTTKPVGTGTGLGLSVVHGIVTGHDGVITVDTERAKGAVFRIFLPALESHPPADTSTPLPLPMGHGQRVLFIDDEQILVELGRRMLNLLHYQCVAFSSAEDALLAVTANPLGFEAVITDLTMPHMTGVELANKLVKVHPGLPIVLATGNISGLDMDLLKQSGIVQILQKPYTVHEVAALMQRILSES